MEFKVGELANLLDGEVLRTTGDGSTVLVKIGGKEHSLRLLRSGTNEFEFILDNTFHHAKIVQSGSSEVKLIVDNQPLSVKKHSKLTEVL
jgi:biotin carboxyl carrier protein